MNAGYKVLGNNPCQMEGDRNVYSIRTGKVPQANRIPDNVLDVVLSWLVLVLLIFILGRVVGWW